MATTRDRGSKSPSPSDDEFYDAFEGSDESDVPDATLHSLTTSTSESPCQSERPSSDPDDVAGQDEAAESDPTTNEEIEGEKFHDKTDYPATPTDTSSAVQPSHTTTKRNSDSNASMSFSPSDDDPSTSADATTIPTPANEVLPVSGLPPRTTAYGSSKKISSFPKKITKKQSRLKWTAAAREVVQSDGEDGCFRRSSSSSSTSSGSERRISTSSMLDDIAQGNIANWDAETAVALLRSPSVSNYSGLKKLMEMASKDWIEDFLGLDGLGVLFESLERLGERGFSSIADALLQLECVLCIKAVMNSTTGLNYITNDSSYVRKLAKALDSRNMLVKKQVFELLSALCVYSECGHGLALDALNNYKVYKSQRYRFQLVMEELRDAEVEDYQTTLLAFINCVVLGAGSLPTRAALRNEFIGLDLPRVLDYLRTLENEGLAVQVAVFDDSYEDDLEQLFGPDAAHDLNHYDAFNALFMKVRDTPHSLQLLGLLINLNQLDLKDQDSDAVWALLDRIGLRAAEGCLTHSWARTVAGGEDTRSVATQTIARRHTRPPSPVNLRRLDVEVPEGFDERPFPSSSLPPSPSAQTPPFSSPPSSPSSSAPTLPCEESESSVKLTTPLTFIPPPPPLPPTLPVFDGKVLQPHPRSPPSSPPLTRPNKRLSREGMKERVNGWRKGGKCG